MSRETSTSGLVPASTKSISKAKVSAYPPASDIRVVVCPTAARAAGARQATAGQRLYGELDAFGPPRLIMVVGQVALANEPADIEVMTKQESEALLVLARGAFIRSGVHCPYCRHRMHSRPEWRIKDSLMYWSYVCEDCGTVLDANMRVVSSLKVWRLS